MSDTVLAGDEVPTDTQTTIEMLESDPAQVYARLRRITPIVRLQALGGRIIFTKAEDVKRVKTDATHFGSFDTTTPMQRAFGGHTLMRKDGCPHLHERRAMEPALAIDQVQQWKPAFERLTDQLLDNLATHQAADLLRAFATPLSAGYLKLVLGLNESGESHLFEWADALVRGAMNANFDPAVFAISDRVNKEMDACFDQMIAKHIASPDGSVLSTMAMQDDPLVISQIRTNMKICIGGAVIETRDALASTIYGLLRHPAQLSRCTSGNEWAACCEEGLRWVAPIQASPRIVKRSVVMRGVLIPDGETVMAVQASANHDEDIWGRPDQFDIQRAPQAHQTFGDGAHQCLGGNVYRLLAADVALPRPFDRFPDLSLSEGAKISFKGFAFRGPTSLSVSLNQTP
jgi:cytochrome P450